MTERLQQLARGDTNFEVPKFGSFTKEEQLMLDSLERERKRAEERGEREGHNQWLVENAPVCIHEISLDGRLSSMNRTGLDMMGCDSVEEIVGVDYMSIPIESHQVHVRDLFRKARSGIASEFEFQADTSGGRQTFLSRFAPTFSSDGAVTNVVGMTIDITQLRRLEAQLNHSQRLEAVGQLAGGIAHDFNNLLAVILGNSELLKDVVQANDTDNELIEEIIATVRRGADLTQRLLTFSRKQVLTPAAVDLHECLAGC